VANLGRLDRLDGKLDDLLASLSKYGNNQDVGHSCGGRLA